MTVTATINGLSEGHHGFHVHADDDISDSCAGAGAHYNPGGYNHGGPGDQISHTGDWGNIIADVDGIARVIGLYPGSLDSISGNIIGRSIVVHEDEDDLGRGAEDSDTLTTGNAGARLACCVITQLDNTALPDGARCNSSKTKPKD